MQKDGGTVSGVFCFGSEIWCWSRAILDRIKGWETKAMRRVILFTKEEDDTWADYLLHKNSKGRKEVDRDDTAVSGRLLKACGEPWDGLVIKECGTWCSNGDARCVGHVWGWHNCGCVWDKVATEWAGDEDWTCRRARCRTIEDKTLFVSFAL